MTDTTQILNDAQKVRFAELCKQVKEGKLSANKAYEFSQADGAVEGDNGFKGSFKSWVETAIEYGWLDKPTTSSEPIQQPLQQRPSTPIVEEKKTNYVMPIVVGAIIAVTLIYAIKKFSKKD